MNIYVGNLPYSAEEDELRRVFEEYGNVTSAKIIKDKYSGQSKGFGFVEMSTRDEGQAAIDGLEGFEMDGRRLSINEAKPREDNRNRGGRGGGGGRW